MLAAWAKFATDHPNLVSSEVVGQTVQGRNIILYKIGNPGAGRVMLSGSTHGFEKAAVEILLMFADWVIHSNDAEAVRIRERNYLLCLPILDIDGYPSLSGMNYNSVNLYRNFDFRWGQELASHTKNPDWTVWTQYCGPNAESEPETRALKTAWLKWLPRNYCDVHVGGSGYNIWYSWLADTVDKNHMIETGKKYLARSPVNPFNWAENAGSSGCPVSASYHNSGKRIWGYVIEVCIQNPVYETIASTHYPNFKEVAITLCQDVESAPSPPPYIPLWTWPLLTWLRNLLAGSEIS